MKTRSKLFISLAGVMGAACVLGVAISCAPFQDSPFSDQLLRAERNLNDLAVDKLGGIEDDGKIRIAVLADSHQNYKDLDAVIYQINQTPNLDFIVNLGDMTNSGYNLEYDQFIDSWVNLKSAPAFTVIGNHDAIGAGPQLFRKAFHNSNFFFESANKRYIFFNSANLEDPRGFNPDWLKKTVTDSTKPCIIFSHMSLRDPERYFDDVATTLGSVVESSQVQLILNGHNHVYSLTTDHSTVMLQSPRVQDGNWLLLEIQGSQLTIQSMGDGATAWETLK